MGRKGKVPDAGMKRSISKKERFLLRTGKLNKEERRIVLLREQRMAAESAPAAAVPAVAAPAPSMATDTGSRLAEAAERGLGGVDETQQLRRLARAHEQDEQARQQAKATALTPAAASLLAQLRGGVS